MDAFVIAENDRQTTKEFAEKWHTDRKLVADWCKAGLIPGAKKDQNGNTAWSIPLDARRPIDSRLIREILWRIVESKDITCRDLDLTDWGISLPDIPECVEVLISNGYLKPATNDGFLSLTKKGYSILGRYGQSAKNAALPTPLEWLSSAGGSFVGNAVKQLIS